MFGFDAPTLASLIVALLSGGVLVSLIDYWRNRKKDKATTDLTDVHTLQAKLAYVEQVAEYLRKHNDGLQQDLDLEQDRGRRMRQRISELEEELDRVKRSAAQTQAECEALGIKLKAMLGEDAV